MVVARAANQAMNRISPMMRNGGGETWSETSAAADARSQPQVPSSRLRQRTTPITASALDTGGDTIRGERNHLVSSIRGLEPNFRQQTSADAGIYAHG